MTKGKEIKCPRCEAYFHREESIAKIAKSDKDLLEKFEKQIIKDASPTQTDYGRLIIRNGLTYPDGEVIEALVYSEQGKVYVNDNWDASDYAIAHGCRLNNHETIANIVNNINKKGYGFGVKIDDKLRVCCQIEEISSASYAIAEVAKVSYDLACALIEEFVTWPDDDKSKKDACIPENIKTDKL